MNYHSKPKYRVFTLVTVSLILFASCNSQKFVTDSSKAKGIKFSGGLKEKYAAVLGVPENQITNEKLYKFIDSWIGVPHSSSGTDKRGIDCSGFTSLLQKDVYNRSVPRVARQIAEQVKRKYEVDLQEGDLVFFDFEGQKFSHVGVYLVNNKFVHTSTSKGVIISDLRDPWYYKYFSRAGTFHSLSSKN
ncbi:C40 family peptidase [Flavihumibacter sp. R14]|nr:C40 family peptidase [Flavihumibacter soli]